MLLIRKFNSLTNRLWKKVCLAGVSFFMAWCVIMGLCMPEELFTHTYSSLLFSVEGELLGARIAPDGQWRFPETTMIPEKYAICLLTFEDRRFRWHPGVDLAGLLRAAWQNFRNKRTVSGGSTITMQLARLSRGNRDRNLWEKWVEINLAFYLELTHRKKTILNLYASHAPFGGNVVGLETAAWRYFGRSANDLSWAESATLAVLPNAPALIHPGRNRDELRRKRDRLLANLNKRGFLSDMDYELACMEPLPGAPLPLPNEAPHLLERMAKRQPGTALHSTLKAQLQHQVTEIVNRYGKEYSSNQIHNLAALIADVETGEVLAYAGNVTLTADERRGNFTDVIMAPRSTGSILKPFLYAGLLHDGTILPDMLVADTPLNINGFTPQNYNRTFQGAVAAHRAIERSLNVPLVRMLSLYNTSRFLELLRKLGMTTLPYSSEHYGASLILGGAEGSLWDLTGIYASLSRSLSHYRSYNGFYDLSDYHPLSVYPVSPKEPILSLTDRRLTDISLLSYSSIWFTFEAMSALNRPEEEAEWQQFQSMKKIAWKTGTSYGGRDAWAIGTTPRYAVGVWVGNASGEGRAGLTGVGSAAPVMFDLFSLLPGGEWFDQPYDDMEEAVVCLRSGHKSSHICNETDTVYIPRTGYMSDVCPYHQWVHLSPEENFRVNSSCEDPGRMVVRSWFVLPPAQEYYYRRYHVDYQVLPPFKPGCDQSPSQQIDIIYPEHNSVLYLPKGFTGEKEKFIFRAAHAHEDAVLYWHLDDLYLGETREEHQIACDPSPGKYVLTLVDNWGNQRKIQLEVK